MQGTTLQEIGIDGDKIRQYDLRIPRYTSYPTAPFWTEEFGSTEYEDYLRNRSGSDRDVSLYVHIPFCARHCRFCACNVIVTQKPGIADEYLDLVEREVRLHARLYKGHGHAVQLHLGGGTPNYLDQRQMGRLVNLLAEVFPFSESPERSIEVDPRRATPDDISRYYHEHRFRRISFGVQDFNAETQLAIGREQAREITFANVAEARRVGYESVNIDLIYGLPRQTTESWDKTIRDTIALRPDRFALYNFAFLPTKLAHQRALYEERLPEASQKLEMFIEAHNRLTQAGYVFIGMDHYALADDPLTQAMRGGTLRRNFMGYTTMRGVDLIAFGVSAISDFPDIFAQNVKKLSAYRRLLMQDRLPTERGIRMSDDDKTRRHVIEEIMCNGRLRFDASVPGVPHADIGAIVRQESAGLRPLIEDGLVTIDAEGLTVTLKGRVFMRNIAVLFDAYIKGDAAKPLFSRAV